MAREFERRAGPRRERGRVKSKSGVLSSSTHLLGFFGDLGGTNPIMATLVKRIITCAKAPAAIGPYSQAVLVDRTMYISGQLGMDPASGELVAGGAKEQAKQALQNIGEILKAADCDYCNVVKTTVLMADMKDFNDINEIYKQFFKCNFPARAAYQVAALPKGARVEIEAIAIKGPLQDASA